MGTTQASAETDGAEKSVATKILFNETPVLHQNFVQS
jgi:hypothetical protein